MSVTRTLAMRATLRSASRRAVPRQLALPAARRTYASQHSVGTGSDLPWLLTSLAVAVPGSLYLWFKGPKKSADDHHHDGHEDAESDSDAEHEKAAGPGEQTGGYTEEEGESTDEKTKESDSGSGNDDGGDDDDASSDHKPKTLVGEKRSIMGQNVPPPSSDNTSMSENWEEKKEGQENFKEVIRAKDTKVASSSSDFPSKKAASEHPREDPQRGEGEGVQKGGPVQDD